MYTVYHLLLWLFQPLKHERVHNYVCVQDTSMSILAFLNCRIKVSSESINSVLEHCELLRSQLASGIADEVQKALATISGGVNVSNTNFLMSFFHHVSLRFTMFHFVSLRFTPFHSVSLPFPV